MTLELYAFPHLMGEAAEYEIDEEDNDEGPTPDVTGSENIEDVEMGGQDAEASNEALTELPRRMADLTVVDEDGDVEMAT